MYGALVFALLAAGCGGGQPAGRRNGAAAPSRAKEMIGDVVAAQWTTIAKPDIASFVAFLAPDVVWFGSGAQEALVGTDAVAADLERVFGGMIAAGASFETRSEGARIGVAPDARSGWASDQVVLTIVSGTDRTEVPYRVTSLVEEKGGKWWIAAQHWSIAVEHEQALVRAAAGKWAPLADLGDGVGPGAEPLVQLFEDTIGDPKRLAQSVSGRDDAFAFLSTPQLAAVGGAAIRRSFGAYFERVAMARKGSVRAELLASGTVAYVATSIEVKVQDDRGELTLPQRVLAVYLKDGSNWRLVQAHFSNGQSAD